MTKECALKNLKPLVILTMHPKDAIKTQLLEVLSRLEGEGLSNPIFINGEMLEQTK